MSTGRAALASIAMGVLLGLFAPAVEAKCCNIIKTQSCADCNFFMCHCKHSCDCKNSCQTNCSDTQTACIADCTQSDCSYCDAWYRACVGRCGAAGASETAEQVLAPGAVPVCEQIYKAVDADHKGGVTKKEFVDFVVAQRKIAWPATGVLTPVQAAVGSIAGKDPATVFAGLDTNHDGTLDRAEAGLP